MQVCYSPQLRSEKKSLSSFRNSGAYTSPGTPEYGDNNNNNNMLGFQKGWCSERVPLSNSNRRHISAAALIPFNSGRTLPSKWDDAERWITSPVSGFGGCKTPQPVQRRAKAKSGPLGGTLEVGYFSNCSPLTTGVFVPDGVVDSSYLDHQDEKNDENGVSRRDMATQMSPESSVEGSPDYIPTPGGYQSARLEVRDVEVDKRVTMIKENRSPEANELALTWNVTQGAMKLSKLEK
ncbi:uncharacterized protein LOC143618082 [Bidens hawaiensis]|uniref:uncharacterized protein LOC143618082 n=1 Tax=Bidens hawaiensis TaxID=980011 RepID=UPI00404A0D43